MTKQDLIIIGSSGHAKVVIDVVEKEGRYNIIGLLDPVRPIGENTLGYEVIGTIDMIPSLIKNKSDCSFFIAIGDNWNRHKEMKHILDVHPEAIFASTIHPSAQIGREVTIGMGVVVMAGAIVNSSTKIGDFTILYTKSSVDHDCTVEPFVSLAPNATTGGTVNIGAFSAIGISASIKHGVKIGEHCVIGGGSMVLKNTESYTINYGVPSKKVGIRIEGDKYL